MILDVIQNLDSMLLTKESNFFIRYLFVQIGKKHLWGEFVFAEVLYEHQYLVESIHFEDFFF